MTRNSTTGTRTTAADIAAAAALGAIDPSTVVLTSAEADELIEAAQREAADAVRANVAARQAEQGSQPERIGTVHQCDIPGCRHGAAHDGPKQPDRQLKLQAECGAVARMTARALATAGGALTDAHGHPFAVAERRAYSRRTAA